MEDTGANFPTRRSVFVTALTVTLAVQIRTGSSIITGQDLGNGFIVVAISVLTVAFTISAVAGIKDGIRLLSNANMALVIVLAVFALMTGPTFFLLDLLPASVIAFFGNLSGMLSVFASEGPAERLFLTTWTTMCWAW